MYEDVEADFWKQILVTMQQKNMVRPGAESLYFDEADKAFNEFSKKYPEVKSTFEMASSYATCEMEISSTIKLRLFIQSQIKGTLLQKNGSDYIKIADAKFPNNPFIEIADFFDHRSDYLEQLSSVTTESIHNSKRHQIAGEFLKALIAKKNPDAIWSLENTKEGFILSIEKNGDKQQKHFDLESITKEINL